MSQMADNTLIGKRVRLYVERTCGTITETTEPGNMFNGPLYTVKLDHPVNDPLFGKVENVMYGRGQFEVLT